MFNEDLEYLTEETLCKTVSGALAELYIRQPPNPIEFLGKWLLAVAKQNSKKATDETKEVQLNSGEIEQYLRIMYKNPKNKSETPSPKVSTVVMDFIKETFKEDLLQSTYLDRLRDHLGLSSLQVWELTYRSKGFDPETDDALDAHLDLNSEPRLKLLAADSSVDVD